MNKEVEKEDDEVLDIDDDGGNFSGDDDYCDKENKEWICIDVIISMIMKCYRNWKRESNDFDNFN